MNNFAQIDQENKGDYLKLLSAVSKISPLFSEGSIPFIHYRVMENIFCRSFHATNLSRSDTAFDAKYNSIGIGLKTFTCNSNQKTEKIAEFNSASKFLKQFQGKNLAIELGKLRNERIDLATNLYNIETSLYHIIARKEKELLLFETDYNIIDIDNIHSVKENQASLEFADNNHFYSFNYSKSTLFRKFIIPKNVFHLPIEIIEDPYVLLLDLFNNQHLTNKSHKISNNKDFVILPLYSTKLGRIIPERSGLNQWNANGRQRKLDEVYIPIPIEIHKKFPIFFPKRETPFDLEIPTGEILNAKVCQDNSKALMTNPNNAIADWLLRKTLKLKEGELATMEQLDRLGFDSVIITKINNNHFQIDIMKTDSYIHFINNNF